jgi:hypothetical protein
MSAHVAWETLNDFVDDRLAPDERSRVATHVLACPECRESLDTLRQTLAVAADLPQSVEVPPEVWTRIGGSIAGSSMGPASRAWWHSPRLLAAAAVGLVATSSGLTALALRDASPASPVASAAVRAEPEMTVLPVSLRAAERKYLASVEELALLLEERRGSLSAKTIAVVERNLADIDIAIAECRAALASDPANAALADVLTSSYRHKVELLRRATQLEERGAT